MLSWQKCIYGFNVHICFCMCVWDESHRGVSWLLILRKIWAPLTLELWPNTGDTWNVGRPINSWPYNEAEIIDKSTLTNVMACEASGAIKALRWRLMKSILLETNTTAPNSKTKRGHESSLSEKRGDLHQSFLLSLALSFSTGEKMLWND